VIAGPAVMVRFFSTLKLQQANWRRCVNRNEVRAYLVYFIEQF